MNAQPPEDVHENGKEPVLRISRHTRELVEDIKSWLDLKVRVTVMEVRSDIENWIRGFAYDGAAAVVFILGILFGLVAASLGLGAWLGHPAWGFAAVMGILWIGALILRMIGKQYDKDKEPASSAHQLKKAEQQRKLPVGKPRSEQEA